MIPSGARVWIAMGHTDMRKGMQGLALQVQQGLKRDPHGGDLFVFRGRTGSLVKIIWHDGIGMSPEEIPIALARFGQVSGDPYKKKYQGAGLGLPIAAGIIQAHRGELLIDSTKGQGTRMTVRLPAAATVLASVN